MTELRVVKVCLVNFADLHVETLLSLKMRKKEMRNAETIKEDCEFIQCLAPKETEWIFCKNTVFCGTWICTTVRS